MEEAENKPTERAQDAVLCSNCPSLVTFFCLTCLLRLCDKCKTSHEAMDATRGHEVVLFSDKYDTSCGSHQCKTHEDQTVQVYCKSCDELACIMCVVNKHNGHKMVSIDEQYEEDIRIHNDETELIQYRLVPGTENSLANNRRNTAEVKRRIEEIRQIMTTKAEHAKETINKGLEKNLNKLQLIESKTLACLDGQENYLQSHLDDLNSQVNRRQEMRDSNDHVTFLLNRKEQDHIDSDILKVPEGKPIPLPIYVGVKSNLQDVCGHIMAEDISALSKESIYERDAPPRKYWKDSPVVILSLDVEQYLADTKLKHVRCSQQDTVWIANNEQRAIKIDMEGNYLEGKQISSSQTFEAQDLAVDENGSLVVCAFSPEPSITRLSKCEQKWDLQSFYKETPYCMCYVNDGLVVLISSGLFSTNYKLKMCYADGSQGQQLLTLDKTVQTVLGDKTYAPDFMAMNPMTKELVISHSENGVLVGVTLNGEYRFKYRGQTPGLRNQKFFPVGVAADKHGHILISDETNACIHLLCNDGQFVLYIVSPENGLTDPYSLSIDNKGHLWIGQRKSMNVKCYEYLM